MSIESKTGRLVFDLVDVLKNRCISGVMQDVDGIERDSIKDVVNSLTKTFEEFKPSFSSNVANFVARETEASIAEPSKKSTKKTTTTARKSVTKTVG